jgi:hypothetical protein
MSTYQRLYRIDFPSDDWRSLGLPMEGRVEVPDYVLADANRRMNAPRTLAAWICGDPAPGQSALDKRTTGPGDLTESATDSGWRLTP